MTTVPIWTPALLAELLDRYASSEESYGDLARSLTDRFRTQFTAEQVRAALRRERTRREYAEHRAAVFPVQSKPRSFTGPERLGVSSVTVVADLHVPYHSAAMLQYAIDMSAVHNSKSLVIAGDLFNFDSVTKWPTNQEPESLQEELRVAGEVLEALARYFSTIHILNGNHDERLSRRVDADLSLCNLVDMALARRVFDAQVIVSDYDYCFANAAGQEWVFGHLSGYSRRPGEMAKNIANRYQAHVAVGHDHMQGFTSTADGNHLCVSIGCMINLDADRRSPMWYKERRLNDYPRWSNGFLIVADGIPWLYNESGSSALNGGMGWDYWYGGM